MSLTFGYATPVGLWSKPLEARQRIICDLADAGIDQVYMADHVSFRNGSGTDGFVEVAALSQLHPTMRVMISIYLLPLRHPLPVARQIATMNTVAPGRFTLGVGVGGEDRHEIEVCGVDPTTRGARANESLAILRGLLTGETVDFDGDHFQIDQARIRPTVGADVPIIVGGRSDAALRRAGRFGDGWVGAWCSTRRFGQAVEIIDEAAEEAGRSSVLWNHGYQPWIGVDADPVKARTHVAEAMETFYKVPFEAFEKYTPVGTPEMVAEQLSQYVDVGCSTFNVKICAANEPAAIDAAGEIAALLRG